MSFICSVYENKFIHSLALLLCETFPTFLNTVTPQVKIHEGNIFSSILDNNTIFSEQAKEWQEKCIAQIE